MKNIRQCLKSFRQYFKQIITGKIPLLKGDKVLWAIYFVLIIISMIEVFSASSMTTYGGNIGRPIMKHISIVLGSTVMAVFAAHFPWKWIKSLTFPLYATAIVVLLATTLFGVEANNAQRSLSIFGVSIQPSEILKPALVFLAAYLFGANHQIPKKNAFYIFWLAVLLPTSFILLESGSTAAILITIAWLICFVSNPIKKVFWRLSLLGAGIAGIFLILILVLPPSVLQHVGRATTWQSRILGNSSGLPDSVYNSLSKAQKDSVYYIIDGDNYQRKHAQIAISRGATNFPFGVLPGNSKSRDYLPEAHNDFIYAIIIEEMGLIGTVMVPLLYLFFYFRLGAWGKKARRKQQSLILYGMGLLYVFQALLNMGVASDLLPLMGQTLPLISTGGSSFLLSAFSFGVTISVSTAIREEREQLKSSARLMEEEASSNSLSPTEISPEEKIMLE